MRLGCIDIGSNTTRLLVADRDGAELVWVHQERVFTRIGHELLERGELGEAKVAEVVAVVSAQLASAHSHGASMVRLIATAAIRRASNREVLREAIAAATGMPVEIVSAEEEARLAFVGVAGTLGAAPEGELGVVDVGGGSAEIVVGTPPATISWWASLPLGSATVTHDWFHSDPPEPHEVEHARAAIDGRLAELSVPRPALAVAVGGSATSLARLAGPTLDPAALERALSVLLSAPAPVIAPRVDIDVHRARLLPAGILILAGVGTALAAPLRVGRGGIREGVLLEAPL